MWLIRYRSCGPTVYDYAHIGNFRAFLTYDLIKRWLSYCGYAVDHICNLTDVDDKIIAKMCADQLTLEEITRKYSNAFFDDLKVVYATDDCNLITKSYTTIRIIHKGPQCDPGAPVP